MIRAKRDASMRKWDRERQRAHLESRKKEARACKQKAKRRERRTRVALRKKIEREQGGLCYYCDAELDISDSARKPTLDHVVPRSQGGPNHETNYVVACYTCNQLKADMVVSEALALHGTKRCG